MSEEIERLYQTMYSSVVRFLYRKVWDADRAEDLAQEVFIRAMTHQPDKPRAWIFAVASNLARDEARAAVRRKKHLTLLTNDPVTVARPDPSPHDQVEREEQLSQVQGALDSLSARDREVLLLWDAGMSYTEIASQTGLAVGAVGTTLARARRRLVEAYDRQQEQEAESRAAHS
ncbi:MAG TPA: sigma-70 family RNA polymerase sigma factor [Gemmatimonadales bacterium]